MIDFYNETSYREYFSNLASEMAGISAFKYGDKDAKAISARSDISEGATLWLDYMPLISGSGEHDHVVGEITASFVVMKPASDRHDTEEEQEQKKAECTALVLEIFRKVRADWDAGTLGYVNEPRFNRLKFGSTDPISFGSSMFAGCAAELPFIIPLNI